MPDLPTDLACGLGAAIVAAVIVGAALLRGYVDDRRAAAFVLERSDARLGTPRSWARQLVRDNRHRAITGPVVVPMPVDPFGDPPLPELDGMALFVGRDLVLSKSWVR